LWQRDIPSHRTTYVCEPFAIDRFPPLASQTVCERHRNGRVAAAHAWRAMQWRRFAARAGLPSAVHV